MHKFLFWTVVSEERVEIVVMIDRDPGPRPDGGGGLAPINKQNDETKEKMEKQHIS